MDFIKNSVLVICMLFLIGCLKFGVGQENLSAFDLNKVTFDQNTYPTVIIGGGIGGLTSAIYLSQAGLKSIVLEGSKPGGAITMSHSVRNWPGEIDISGTDLVEKIKKQAIANNVEIAQEEVTGVDFSMWPYKIKVKNVLSDKTRTIKALSCIISMGTTPNFLNIKGERNFWGRGVSGCAVCDGPLYKNKTVAIIGGGNAAIAEADYLSNIANKVFIIVRKEELRVGGKEVEKLLKKSNVQVLYNSEVKEIKGDKKSVKSISVYNNKDNKTTEVSIDGLFLAIGSTPNSRFFENQLEIDSSGYIVLKKDQETSKKGIFTIGDISDPIYKQAITAAGSGCQAALQTQSFLKKIGYEIGKSLQTTKSADRQDDRIDKKVIEILNENEFEKVVMQSKLPVIVDFYTDWCIPCKKMTPIFENLANKFAGKIKFVKVNASKNSEIAHKMSITSVPTFIFIKNGKTVKQMSGTTSFEDFAAIVTKTFKI